METPKFKPQKINRRRSLRNLRRQSLLIPEEESLLTQMSTLNVTSVDDYGTIWMESSGGRATQRKSHRRSKFRPSTSGFQDFSPEIEILRTAEHEALTPNVDSPLIPVFDISISERGDTPVFDQPPVTSPLSISLISPPFVNVHQSDTDGCNISIQGLDEAFLKNADCSVEENEKKSIDTVATPTLTCTDTIPLKMDGFSAALTSSFGSDSFLFKLSPPVYASPAITDAADQVSTHAPSMRHDSFEFSPKNEGHENVVKDSSDICQVESSDSHPCVHISQSSPIASPKIDSTDKTSLQVEDSHNLNVLKENHIYNKDYLDPSLGIDNVTENSVFMDKDKNEQMNESTLYKKLSPSNLMTMCKNIAGKISELISYKTDCSSQSATPLPLELNNTDDSKVDVQNSFHTSLDSANTDNQRSEKRELKFSLPGKENLNSLFSDLNESDEMDTDSCSIDVRETNTCLEEINCCSLALKSSQSPCEDIKTACDSERQSTTVLEGVHEKDRSNCRESYEYDSSDCVALSGTSLAKKNVDGTVSDEVISADLISNVSQFVAVSQEAEKAIAEKSDCLPAMNVTHCSEQVVDVQNEYDSNDDLDANSLSVDNPVTEGNMEQIMEMDLPHCTEDNNLLCDEALFTKCKSRGRLPKRRSGFYVADRENACEHCDVPTEQLRIVNRSKINTNRLEENPVTTSTVEEKMCMDSGESFIVNTDGEQLCSVVKNNSHDILLNSADSFLEDIVEPVTKRKATRKRRRSADYYLDEDVILCNNDSINLPENDEIGDSRYSKRLRRKSNHVSKIEEPRILLTNDADEEVESKSVDNITIDSSTTEPTLEVTLKKSRRKKSKPEIPLEDIYRNKNYKRPDEKMWETIYESPGKKKQPNVTQSQKRFRRYIQFETYQPLKMKRRIQRANKMGWNTRGRKMKIVSQEVFQQKLIDISCELEEAS